MSSIKAKFTFTLTLVLFGAICIFFTVIYFTSISHFQTQVTPEVLQELGNNNPKLKTALVRINANQALTDVYTSIQKEENSQYTKTILILIPPTLLFTAIIAYAVSSFLLRPIEEFARNLKRIDSKNLSARLPTINTSTEIEYLITEFNTLLAELEEAFTYQDQFISDAAHELRTPIAAIKTNIQVFKESNNNTKEDSDNLINIIEKINNKLQKLNENLLFLNSKYKGKFNFEKVELNALIEDTIESISYLAKNKSIEIILEKNKDIYALVDSARFSIVIKNILENAIKYSKENTLIKIKLFEDNNVNIEIQDQGIGMNEEHSKRIFDRFYRANNAIVNNEEGEGLGLSIVKKIIDAHHGKVSVESKLGEGSKFIIFLPKIAKNQ